MLNTFIRQWQLPMSLVIKQECKSLVVLLLFFICFLTFEFHSYSTVYEWSQVMPGVTSFSNLMQWYADPGTAPAFSDQVCC